MKKYSKLMAVLLVVAMLLPGIAQAAPKAEKDVVRLAGGNRIETSVEVSKEAYESADAVVLAGYNGEVDALAGTLLANAKNAPLLFTNKDKLAADVKAEIKRLGAKKVYVLGGDKVVFKAVVTELKGLGLTVTRVAGDNRAETAVEVAKEAGGKTEHVFLARGYGDLKAVLADALAVGPASAKKDMPVLLTQTGKVSPATLEALKDLGVKNITIVGAAGAVSAEVETQLKKDYKVDRIAGSNRERTAIAIADKFFPNADKAVVANGYGSPDALVGGYLGAKIDAPILFSLDNRINVASIDYMVANTDFAYVLGGTGAINADVLSQVEKAVKGEEVVEGELKVESVSAINGTTLEVKGEGLSQLKAEDITVAGTGVASIVVSEDGKTATVNLTGAVAPNKDTKVTVKGTDFTVNFNFEPKTVAVMDGVYNDDTARQFVTVKINDSVVTTDYLHTAGYTVDFKAYDQNTGADVTATVFANTATGELNAIKITGKYNVQVVVSQGSTILTSPYATIEIRNLDNASTTAESYRIETIQQIKVSNVLVRGEQASFTKLYVGNGDTIVDAIAAGSDVKVTSSDNGVISVNPSNNQMTAVGLGTATVTAKVGNATRAVTLTVKGDAREASSIKAANEMTTIMGANGNKDFTVVVLDQYGDRVVSPSSKVTVSYPTNVNFNIATAVDGTLVGDLVLTLDGSIAGQSGSVVFKNTATGALLGTSTVKVSNVNNVTRSILETIATDNVINPNNEMDDTIVYTLEKYNSDNVWNGTYTASELSGYTVKFNGKIIEINGVTNTDTNAVYAFTGLDKLTITGKKAGTTTVSLYNTLGQLVDSKSITVNSNVAKLTGVNWTSTSSVVAKDVQVNYETILPVTKSTTTISDDVIDAKALNLSSAIVNKVRIGQYTLPGAGSPSSVIYVDKNDNGVFEVGETVLGELQVIATTDSTSISGITATDAFTGYTTVEGAKGKLVFNVINPDGNTVASKTITIDVPKNAAQLISAQVSNFENTYKDLKANPTNYTDAYVTIAAKAYNALPQAVKDEITTGTVGDAAAAQTTVTAIQDEVFSRFFAMSGASTINATLDHYKAVGVIDVTAGNLAAVNAAVLAGGVDHTVASTLQTIVDDVIAVAIEANKVRTATYTAVSEAFDTDKPTTVTAVETAVAALADAETTATVAVSDVTWKNAPATITAAGVAASNYAFDVTVTVGTVTVTVTITVNVTVTP